MDASGLDEPSMPDVAMENAMNGSMDPTIDELFGEASEGLTADGLGVPLSSAPLPPDLVLHTMNMQARGGRTKLAWSNCGIIAQIHPDGNKISFRSLRREPTSGRWVITEESKHPLIPANGAVWEHMKFSKSGIELAVVDSLGRVFIHALTGAIGKMPLAPNNFHRKEHPCPDLDAVVGLHWLAVYPMEFKMPNISAATKNGERWSTFLRHRDPSEPMAHHPLDNQRAVLIVSRDARLTLMFQVELFWHAVDSRLDDMSSSMDLLSHAAMGERDEHMLILTHDTSKRFRLYKIDINWNVTTTPRPGSQHPLISVAPTFTIGHLTTMDHISAQQADAAQLSQLHIVPAIPGHAATPDTTSLPTILAIFTYASIPANLMQHNQEVFSIVARWHIETATSTLHEAFGKLKVNGTSTASGLTLTRLKREEDVFTNKLVLSFASQNLGTTLTFTASDGTVEYRDRQTMASIEPYPDSTTVSSLSQCGFEYVADTHCIHVAPSGDGSSLVGLRPNGELVYRTMTLRYTWHPIMDEGGLLEAAIVCLARQYTLLSLTNISTDETLALLPLDTPSEMRLLFIKEIIKMMDRNLDISMQDANRQQYAVFKEPLLSKPMSSQFVLGCKPGTTEITFRGKYAYAFLNVRLVVMAIGNTMKPEAYMRPEYLISLRGLVQWGSDFMVYVAANIIATKREWDTASADETSDFGERFINAGNSPILHILLCTFSRIYVRYLIMCVARYLQHVERAINSARSLVEREQLTEISQKSHSLPFRYADFEIFIATIDTAVRNAYTQGTVTMGRRQDIELSAITCELPIPDEFRPALDETFATALPKFLEKVDMAKLAFWDTSWLGIEPSSDAQQYDVVRKIPLTKDMKLRVCRRCGALMEDISQELAKELPPTIVGFGKQCICTDYWILEE